VIDRAAFQPVATGVALIEEFRRQDPGRFGWKPPPYEYEHERLAVDLLYGSDDLRRGLEAGDAAESITATWPDQVATFLPIRQRYLLY
jgi:uncharacterized protein YbbC (DUF1343 family)